MRWRSEIVDERKQNREPGFAGQFMASVGIGRGLHPPSPQKKLGGFCAQRLASS